MKLATRNLKHNAFKIALFSFLIAIFVLAGSFALGADDKSKQIFSPMELSYPNIPGLGRFSDYQNLDPSLQIGFIVSYIFKLVFFISIGAGLVALLVAGVMYLVSSSKPKWIMLSRQMASNAMLGLFILLCAYLLLYVINPQLLSLTLTKPKLDQIVSTTASPYAPDTTVAQKVSVTEDLNSAVDNLQEKVYLVLKNAGGEPTGQYAEKLKGGAVYCFSDGYGGAVDRNGKYLADMDDKDPVEKIIKASGCVTAGAVDVGKFVYRAEIPLRETAEALKVIAPLVAELKKSLEQCKCGMSLGYSGKSECVPGIEDPKEIKKNQDAGNFCLNQAEDCGTKKMMAGNATYLACDLRDVRKNIETGKFEVCMRDNTKNGVNIKNALPVACAEKDNCWVPINGSLTEEFVDARNDCGKLDVVVSSSMKGVSSLIKLKTIKIQEQQAKMQARAKIDARFLDSATLIARALNANSMEFSTSQAIGEWGFAFSERAKGIKNLVIQDSKDTGDITAPTPAEGGSSGAGYMPKSNGFLARLKSFFSPFITSFAWAQSDAYLITQAVRPGTFFYITTAPADVQDPLITAKNADTFRNSRRYNLFSLLTDLPLEGIEQIFRDCLAAAFGTADYSLDQGQIEDVVKAVMDSGAAEHLKAVIQKMIDDQTIADKIVIDTGNAIADDATVAFIKPYLAQCKCGAADADAQKYAKSLFDGTCSIIKDTCCYCVKNLMSNGVPPNYLSKTFSAVFTTSLATKLPYINGILNTNVINILFPPNDPKHPIGDFLNKPSKDIYNAIFKGALTEPFDQQVPGLDKLLDKQMKDVLPDFIVNQITKINNWFENTIASSTSNAKRASNFLANRLVNELVAQPMAQWADNFWEKNGVGAETIKGCFDKFEQGYIYRANNGLTTKAAFQADIDQYGADVFKYLEKLESNVTNNPKPKEPGKCFKMTPEEITTLFRENKNIPKSFNYNTEFKYKGVPVTDPVWINDMQDSNFFTMNNLSTPTICENAKYDWEQISEKCLKTNDVRNDIASAGEAIANVNKVEVGGALVNYAEKLSVAFAETALQFALAYARVFVEDNFITPLLGYWNAISGFQQGMQNFLTTSVKGILPAQISGFLQSNIVDQIEVFCKQYKDAKNALPKGSENADITFKIKIDLPKDVFWDKKNFIEQDVVDIPQETGDKICDIQSSLSVTPWQAITEMCNRNENTIKPEDKVAVETKLCEAVDILNEKLILALNDVCKDLDPECNITTWFNKPLLSIFFPHYKKGAIEALIVSTPKDFLCGETPIFSATQCVPIMKKGYGIIPVFNTGLTQEQEDLKPWCTFVYAGCHLPVNAQKTTVGEFIKTIVDTSCKAYDPQSGCAGQCYRQYFPKDETTCNNDETKTICKSCSFLGQNSVFYSLLYESVKVYDEKASDRTPETKFYKGMQKYFSEFSGDIAEVAKSRGITLINTGQDGFGFSDLIALLGKGSIEKPTIRNMLKQNEILKLTPYQAIIKYVCDSNKEEGTDEYALCKILSSTPQEMMGLDKPLKEFIRPKEFIILFDMLQDLKDGSASDCQTGEQFYEENGQAMCCDAPVGVVGRGLCYKVGEKPAGLKQLLDFMSEKDFVDVLKGLQTSMPKDSQPNQSIYPYTFYFSADPTNNPTCLGIGNPISVCSSPTPQILSGYGIPGTAVFKDASPEEKNDLSERSYIVKDNILGKVTGTDTKGNPVTYYLVETTDESNLIFAFKEPTNPEKVAFGTAISFMTTETGNVADKIFGSQTIADYICDNIAMKVDYYPNYPSAFLSANISMCDVPILENWLNIALRDRGNIIAILKSTPLDLVAKYFTKSMAFSSCRPKPLNLTCKQGEKLNDKGDQCCIEISFMDSISANTALGQPMIDTLGALTGWDKLIKDKIGDPIAGFTSKAAQWADNGAKAGVKSIQDGLNNALVEWPKSLAPEWLAEFYGFNVGKKTATDIAGSCYPRPTSGPLAGKCDTKKGEIEKNANTPNPECCILAKGESCQPRCREVDSKVKQCDVLSGEMPNVDTRSVPGKSICCFAGVDDIDLKNPQGFWQSEPLDCRAKPTEGCAVEEIVNPANDNQCCISKKQFCKKARAVDFSAGSKCRTQDETGTKTEDKPYEIPDEANGVCVFKESYRRTFPPLPDGTTPTIEDQGFCCSTVSQCIANKFSSHLENIAEMMADGNIPLQSLKK